MRYKLSLISIYRSTEDRDSIGQLFSQRYCESGIIICTFLDTNTGRLDTAVCRLLI